MHEASGDGEYEEYNTQSSVLKEIEKILKLLIKKYQISTLTDVNFFLASKLDELLSVVHTV